jgi:Domain of unknown function (DUF4139)
MRARTLIGVGIMAVLLGGDAGCGKGAIVQSELPIRRVVVYRNGVAYFERAGSVHHAEVRFKMRQSEVGDFLATLAVMEAKGGTVQSAAFPLKDLTGKKDADAENPDDALRTVELALDGQDHDLQVGYIAAAPVWRPSYRLILQPDGRAELQAWGIVENLSGEDWRGVHLALVAGAPLTFDSQLGTPVIPTRAVVTDNGEVIMSMPRGETSVAQDESPSPEPPPPPPVATAAAPAASAATGGEYNYAAPQGRMAKEDQAPMGSPQRPRLEGYVQPSVPRSVGSLAAVAVQGGTTRYELPNVVTVPDRSATMVMLLAVRVPGKAIYEFAPDPGVPDSASHPFHVVRFENGTAGLLERGPIAVFEKGSFMGQGLMDPLPAAATATVQFALERAIGVDQTRKSDVQGTRLAKIADGNLWLEHDIVLKTTYDLQNGNDTEAEILVKHARSSGTRLHEPPPGTEDNTGTGSALVPGRIPAHGKQKLVVDERSATRDYSDWFSIAADNAIKDYLKDKNANPTVARQLQAAWPLRGEITSKQEQRNKRQTTLNQLNGEAGENRANLRAIEKNKAADALRKSLTARLAVIAAQQDTLTAETIQLGQEISELQIRWREAIRVIKLDEPPPAK